MTPKLLFAGAICAVVTLGVAAQEPRPSFDVNDVAILWPVPKNKADVAELLSADDAMNGSTLWPKTAFDSVLTLVQTASLTSSTGEPSTISFPPESRDEILQPHNWKVVGLRVDPCAPGCDPSIAAAFGAAPQVRLIFQPVTIGAGDAVVVHDVAAHVVFNFTAGARRPPFTPDRAAFGRVIDDLVTIKQMSEKGNASTAGPLKVHPGLAAGVSGIGERVKNLVRANLLADRIFAISFMGLAPVPEPWLFFSAVADGAGRFVPAPQPVLGKSAAQLLTFQSSLEPVFPVPITSNLEKGRGVSTNDLFKSNATADAAVFPDLARPLKGDVPDLIANPARSHFFNTDCVSCHTETTRRAAGMVSKDGAFAFDRPARISGVDPSHLPATKWNTRNFGWFQSRAGKPIAPTISQRTANEAAESASQINAQYLSSAAVIQPNAAAALRRNAIMEQTAASPLTLVMKIKSQKDFLELKALIDQLQSLPPDQNPIAVALNRLGTVHFARFVFIEERLLAVITTYDGSFEDYIDAFINAIGGVFDKLLAHIDGAPPLPVAQNRDQFLDFVRRNDLQAIPPFYSAYPNLKTKDILILQKKFGQ